MSTSQAIAGITIMLEFLIQEGFSEAEYDDDYFLTAKPPDKARTDDRNQINIFLYQTLPNSAWRNTDMPKKVKPGETGKPPLALNLYYLITAYGAQDENTKGHNLLGIAMSALHDHPTIRSRDIKRAIDNLVSESDKKELIKSNLKNQIERISVTPITLSLEEVSKVWGTFQTAYRISAAYEVSTVLIESKAPVKAPLPVLSIGSDNSGIAAQTGLFPPVPGLAAIKLPGKQYYFSVESYLILEGYNLKSESGESGVKVLLKHPLNDTIELTPTQATNRQITVKITADKKWRSGFYTVIVKVTKENRELMTNALTFPLVPEVTEITYPDNQNNLKLTCNTPVQKEQQVALLLGDREITYQFSEEETEPRSELTFDVSKVASGKYVVRLRVDGVDSVPIDFEQKPPVFKDDQKVTI